MSIVIHTNELYSAVGASLSPPRMNDHEAVVVLILVEAVLKCAYNYVTALVCHGK